MVGKKKIFVTIITSGMAFAINYLINFYLTRYINQNMSTEAYGFVTLAKTMTSYALIATLALNSYAARFISLEYHKGNKNKANVYFSSVFIGDILLGIILLLLGLIVLVFAQKLFSIPNSIVHDIRILFFLVFINLFIDLSGTAFQSAAYIKNKLNLSAVIKCLSYIIEGAILFMLYTQFKPRLFYVGCGLLFATCMMVASNFIICRKFVPDLIVSFKSFKMSAVKELLVNGVWNSLNSLGNTLNSGLDLIVANSLLGAFAMGQVSVVKTMTNIFNGLFQMASQPFQPHFLKCYAEDDKPALLESLKYSMKLCGLVSNLAFAEVVSLGLYYYKLWVPSMDCQLLYQLSIVGVGASLFEGAVYPLFYIYTLTVKNKIPCIITIIGGLLNVLGMHVLIKYTSMGIYAVFLTTTVVMLVINGITNPIYMAHCLDLKWNYFYPTLLKYVLSCIVITFSLKIISLRINPTSWMLLIGTGAIFAVVGAIEHVIIMFGAKEGIQEVKQICKKLKD